MAIGDDVVKALPPCRGKIILPPGDNVESIEIHETYRDSIVNPRSSREVFGCICSSMFVEVSCRSVN